MQTTIYFVGELFLMEIDLIFGHFVNLGGKTLHKTQKIVSDQQVA